MNYSADEPFDEFEDRPETQMSEQTFSVLEAGAASVLLNSSPEVRNRVKQAGTRGFLPIALGVLVGGVLGYRLAGAFGLLIGVYIGSFVGLRLPSK